MVYQTEETRQKILGVAELCFTESGFFETQMKDIAEAVGMSRNTLYRYYHNKLDLAFAIFELAYTRLASSMLELQNEAEASRSNALDAFMDVLEHLLTPGEHSIDERFLAEFDAYFTGARITAPLRERISKTIDLGAYQQLVQMVEAGQTDGSIRKDISSSLLTASVVNAARALQQRIILRGDALIEVSAEELRQLNRVHLELIRSGLRPPSAM